MPSRTPPEFSVCVSEELPAFARPSGFVNVPMASRAIATVAPLLNVPVSVPSPPIATESSVPAALPSCVANAVVDSPAKPAELRQVDRDAADRRPSSCR